MNMFSVTYQLILVEVFLCCRLNLIQWSKTHKGVPKCCFFWCLLFPVLQVNQAACACLYMELNQWEDLKKNSSTLIKVIVALSNLSVFKCLQDVHVNFMNPSVFVIQPSAKRKKMSFPTETEAERDWLTYCPCAVSWTALGAIGSVTPQLLEHRVLK